MRKHPRGGPRTLTGTPNTHGTRHRTHTSCHLSANTIASTRYGSYIAGFPGNPIRGLTIRNLTMTMKDDPESDFSANRDWRPPAEDGFRVPKSNALPFGLSFYCVEGLQLEGYRMVSGHPEWWIKDVKHFD